MASPVSLQPQHGHANGTQQSLMSACSHNNQALLMVRPTLRSACSRIIEIVSKGRRHWSQLAAATSKSLPGAACRSPRPTSPQRSHPYPKAHTACVSIPATDPRSSTEEFEFSSERTALRKITMPPLTEVANTIICTRCNRQIGRVLNL